MILKTNDVPLRKPDMSNVKTNSCGVCKDYTLNLCAKCGVLKVPGIEHCGRLPGDAHEVLVGRCPSWKMFHVGVSLSAIGGFIIGLDWKSLIAWIGL